MFEAWRNADEFPHLGIQPAPYALPTGVAALEHDPTTRRRRLLVLVVLLGSAGLGFLAGRLWHDSGVNDGERAPEARRHVIDDELMAVATSLDHWAQRALRVLAAAAADPRAMPQPPRDR